MTNPPPTYKASEIVLRAIVEDAEGARTEYTLQTDNRDRIRYELTAAKRNWPSIASEQALFLFLTVCAWSALKRSGELPAGLDLDTFLDRCVVVEPVKGEDGQPAMVDVDPTQPATSEPA